MYIYIYIYINRPIYIYIYIYNIYIYIYIYIYIFVKYVIISSYVELNVFSQDNKGRPDYKFVHLYKKDE